MRQNHPRVEQCGECVHAAATSRPTIPEQIADTLAAHSDNEDELTTKSNAAVDLVNAGRLDEAERAARDLLQRFPDAHDGWDRLGMVCYRKVIEFVRGHPDRYAPGFEAAFHQLVRELDPSPAT